MTGRGRGDGLRSAAWRLAVFATVCSLGGFAMVAVFGQLRFNENVDYGADFVNVSGLEEGNFVRIAGVEVGKVEHITVQPDSRVSVRFSVDESVLLTEGTRALIRYDNLIGGRFLELQEGAGAPRRLSPGETIGVANTEPALDLDALIGGFRPLFRALDPEQVNALAGQLVAVFQGQGPTVEAFLARTAALTGSLADRDQLLTQVIDNLSTVLNSLADQSDRFGAAVDSLSDLISGLSDRRSEIATGLAYTDAAASSIADLLSRAREPAHRVVEQVDRTADLVMADREYFDDLLNTLPDAYRILSRQGIYGDYFSFYLCDLLLKVNGKGGQPVYIKVAGQSTGRCAPK
ncbi:MCE family protein [Mycobacterium deserti]|uniref:MCE family protein n=1 Tax=Mycobacterium deserti TaxID=2978347 RepID=A0ABT2MA26_9MYCO|nr:MCE family protein [Mycobacterium deserti]MCT7657856.1 MCE family protein [Mycobacterium deserti]